MLAPFRILCIRLFLRADNGFDLITTVLSLDIFFLLLMDFHENPSMLLRYYQHLHLMSLSFLNNSLLLFFHCSKATVNFAHVVIEFRNGNSQHVPFPLEFFELKSAHSGLAVNAIAQFDELFLQHCVCVDKLFLLHLCRSNDLVKRFIEDIFFKKELVDLLLESQELFIELCDFSLHFILIFIFSSECCFKVVFQRLHFDL
mmetsp:Transcript_15571/g.33978  ORF Transcript_15571/g.33978 Transcript_15571/m.33978 type:complete len:201 (-) Transcript_15571:809-1411(-)